MSLTSDRKKSHFIVGYSLLSLKSVFTAALIQGWSLITIWREGAMYIQWRRLTRVALVQSMKFPLKSQGSTLARYCQNLLDMLNISVWSCHKRCCYLYEFHLVGRFAIPVNKNFRKNSYNQERLAKHSKVLALKNLQLRFTMTYLKYLLKVLILFYTQVNP